MRIVERRKSKRKDQEGREQAERCTQRRHPWRFTSSAFAFAAGVVAMCDGETLRGTAPFANAAPPGEVLSLDGRNKTELEYRGLLSPGALGEGHLEAELEAAEDEDAMLRRRRAASTSQNLFGMEESRSYRVGAASDPASSIVQVCGCTKRQFEVQ